MATPILSYAKLADGLDLPGMLHRRGCFLQALDRDTLLHGYVVALPSANVNLRSRVTSGTCGRAYE